ERSSLLWLAVLPTGMLAAQISAPQTPPVATAGVAHPIAAVAVGGAPSVNDTVGRSPLRCALVASRSMLGHASGSPIESVVSPAGSVTAWSVIGYAFIAAMFCPL